MPAPEEAPTGPLRQGGTTSLRAPSATLWVSDGGAPQAVALGGSALHIGRAADCELTLRAAFVSSYHARIDPSGLAHTITDTGSLNGLSLAGRRLPADTPIPLADGDVIRIGEAGSGGLISLRYTNSAAPRLATGGTPRRSIPLDPADATLTLGRAGCTILLDHPLVSRQHARLERQGRGYLLRDLGSANGTFVNGRRIASATLQQGDLIQIGMFKLIFRSGRLDEYDERGGLRLDARQLTRTVEREGTRQRLLREVSLSLRPRELVAIVGPSGAGKSTLLGALAGYAPADSGVVLINGQPRDAAAGSYQGAVSYLPQDDSLHAGLKVAAALHYTALLRLPDDTTPQERARRVDHALDEVDLQGQGQQLVAALSGGQRKRACIAAELLAEPGLFFLDEPTAGLDPGLEKKLILTLRRLADGGRTVTLVTHATANLLHCDQLAVMAEGGRLVFFGPPDEALRFFEAAAFDEIYGMLEGQAARWEQRFRSSEFYQRNVVERLDERPTQPIASPPGTGKARRAAGTSPWRQLRALSARRSDLLLRDRRTLALMLLQAPVIALLLAAVARPNALVGEGAYAGEARKVLFVLATTAVWCGMLNGARELVKERVIWRRERLAGLGVAPYLLSKLAPLGLLLLAQSALLLLALGLRVAYPATGVLLPGWAELGLTTLLAGLAGLALGLLVSALARNPDQAIGVAPLLLIPQLLFAGPVFGLDEGGGLSRALSWLTISRWAMDAYGATANLNALELAPGLLPVAAPEYTPTPAHLLSRWAVLLGYAGVCALLAGLALRRGERG
jgi:ABC transport system ATP-binding/permease protein